MNIWSVATYVAKSDIHGQGRFADQNIAQGTIVLQIDGNIHKNENQSYVNHSLKNNLNYIGDKTWIANKEIAANDELTMNYLQWVKSVPF